VVRKLWKQGVVVLAMGALVAPSAAPASGADWSCARRLPECGPLRHRQHDRHAPDLDLADRFGGGVGAG
jgi:hypothetical protein